MVDWVMRDLDQQRSQVVSQGFAVGQRHPIHCRWMGGLAASGRRQALFTCQDLASARQGFQASFSWWVPVETDIDARGWRMVSCRWFLP